MKSVILNILLLWSCIFQISDCFQQVTTKHITNNIDTYSTSRHQRFSGSIGLENFSLPRNGSVKCRMLEQDNWTGILNNSDVWVFLIGIFPFAWASVEFWRRIAFGEAFGTGSDQVIIGMDDMPSDSRGRRVLGKGALFVAYFLFAASFATIGVVFYSVISSSPAPEFLPSQQVLQDSIDAIQVQ